MRAKQTAASSCERGGWGGVAEGAHSVGMRLFLLPRGQAQVAVSCGVVCVNT